MTASTAPKNEHHTIILGAGFAGIQAARALGNSGVRVTLVDRKNHHLFQPLLYQVATASLAPADIAAPIRHIVAPFRNTEVFLGSAEGIDLEHTRVHLADRSLHYDSLVVATGVRHAYFGNTEWEKHAPGLKTVEDAFRIRERFLMAFERAEHEDDPSVQQSILTFIIVGGGPTGVELAGAMAEIARHSMGRDFRRIDPSTARIILVEGNDRVLKQYDKKLCDRAKKDLESLGVEVRLNTRVTDIDDTCVWVGEDRIPSRNVFWAAGVQAEAISGTLGVETDRSGRVPVRPDLSIEGHPDVFVVGDLAKVIDPKSGEEIPGVAPAAIQMGMYVGKLIRARAEGKLEGEPEPFTFRDKGMLATIGRSRAVGRMYSYPVTGFVAWALWALVHILFLVGFRNRAVVIFTWIWAYVTYQRRARISSPEKIAATAETLREPVKEEALV